MADGDAWGAVMDTVEVNDRGILFKGRMVNAIDGGAKTQTRRLAAALRVRPRAVVRSDLPQGIPGWDVAVGPGRSYQATIGDAGAVSAVTASGERLGLKPGEFDLVCPYASGRTYLDNGVWRIDVAPDQRLWVRETWSRDCRTVYPCPDVWYRADFTEHDDPVRREHDRECKDGQQPQANCFACAGVFKWRPAIHMPRARARLRLMVEAVRLERLQAITEEDARAEGARVSDAATARQDSVDVEGMTPYVGAFAALWDSINAARTPWESNPWVWVVKFRRIW